MGSVHPHLRIFLISDLVIPDIQKIFASVVKIISEILD